MDRGEHRAAPPSQDRAAINLGLDVLAPLYAAETEVGREFDAVRAKDGRKAALAWRKQQMEE